MFCIAKWKIVQKSSSQWKATVKHFSIPGWHCSNTAVLLSVPEPRSLCIPQRLHSLLCTWLIESVHWVIWPNDSRIPYSCIRAAPPCPLYWSLLEKLEDNAGMQSPASLLPVSGTGRCGETLPRADLMWCKTSRRPRSRSVSMIKWDFTYDKHVLHNQAWLCPSWTGSIEYLKPLLFVLYHAFCSMRKQRYSSYNKIGLSSFHEQ